MLIHELWKDSLLFKLKEIPITETLRYVSY
jgi:hypothetical protein